MHGARAIRRYVASLLRCFLEGDGDDHCHSLWINPKVSALPVPASSRHRPHVTPLPGRLLRVLWRRAAWPPVERFLGPVDVFHATQLEFPPARRAPVIWTIHGLAYLAEPERLDPHFVKAARAWHALAVERCDWFIAVSEATRAEFLAAHPGLGPRCVVIPLGVGAEFRPEGPLSNEAASPYLLYVGAVARHKNIQGLLAAYDIFRRRGGDARLVLAGPVDRAFLDRQGVGPGVTLTGPIDQDGPRLAELYRGARGFVFPSFYEGWASPPLEAMASGVPVVVSNASSLPETVGDAALQVDPHDVEALAAAMAAVVDDQPLRSSLIARGLARAASFTWERAAAETMALYRRVASA